MKTCSRPRGTIVDATHEGASRPCVALSRDKGRLSRTPQTLASHFARLAWAGRPGEGDRVIKVRKKIFVFLGDGGIGVKLTHSNAAALGLPFCQPMAYGLGRSGWVSIDLTRGRKPPTDLLETWIDESYRAVAPKTLVARLANSTGG